MRGLKGFGWFFPGLKWLFGWWYFVQNCFWDKYQGSFIIFQYHPDIPYPFGQNGFFQRLELHHVNERTFWVFSFQ